MKDAKIFLFIFAVIIGCFTVYSLINKESAAERQYRIEIQRIELENRAIHSEMRREKTTQLYSEFVDIALPLFIFLVLSLTGLFIWRAYDLRQESWHRPVDGMFALQNLGRWKVDPGKQVTGIVGYDSSTKQLACDLQTVGVDRQLDYAKHIEKTRTMIAANSGNGIRNTAQAKWASGYYDRQMPVVQTPPVVPQLPELTLYDAFTQSTSDKWILGQSKETGATYAINPKESNHFGVVGATGTGKTAFMGLLLMSYVLKHGQRFIILDGKGGADWSKYQNIIEYQPLDYTNILGIVAQLESYREHRQQKLNKMGINSIWQAPKPPQAIYVMIDEFGAVMDSLKLANPRGYKQTATVLSNLLRLSRSTGIYFTFCDQDPTKWPSSMAANLTDNICFKLGGNKGSAVSEYNLASLSQGEFQVGNERYFAYPTYTVIDGILGDIKPAKPKALLTVTGDGRGVDQSIEPSIANTGYAGYTPKIVTGEVVTSGYKPMLDSEPVTATDKQLVWETYCKEGSKNKTLRKIWGGKNDRYLAWLNSVIAEYEGKQ